MKIYVPFYYFQHHHFFRMENKLFMNFLYSEWLWVKMKIRKEMETWACVDSCSIWGKIECKISSIKFLYLSDIPPGIWIGGNWNEFFFVINWKAILISPHFLASRIFFWVALRYCRRFWGIWRAQCLPLFHCRWPSTLKRKSSAY